MKMRVGRNDSDHLRYSVFQRKFYIFSRAYHFSNGGEILIDRDSQGHLRRFLTLNFSQNQNSFKVILHIVSFSILLVRISRSVHMCAHTHWLHSFGTDRYASRQTTHAVMSSQRNTTRSYLIAGVKTIRGVELALGLAAAIRQRGRSDERLMMEFEFRSRFHRVAVGLPLAGEMRSAAVP